MNKIRISVRIFVSLRVSELRHFPEEIYICFRRLQISSRVVRCSLAALVVTTCMQISTAQSGVTPAPRTDRNSQIAHEQLVEKARRGGIDVYFVGDSITRRWGTSDAQYRDFFDNWRRNFFGWNAANFGWGADTVQNILWRVSNGELDGVQPKIIVLLAGTNNVGNAPRAGIDAAVVNEVLEGIDAIVSVMRAKAPGATIVITGVTPRRDRNGGPTVMATIDAINKRLASLATGTRTRYVDINGRLATRDGGLVDGVTVDGLHLSVAGYQIWADALKPIFTELLGPPAATDHAPPPTGDPSAR
jgi:lysophospholipase L1-like esterase